MKKLQHILLISLFLIQFEFGFAQHRIIISTDFPAFPVTNSDPDDVQSIVRFLLYSNEFDVEGLIASAGTFGMVAEKKNILAVLDEYDKVDENLRKHDSKYPTADALRAVTYEGKGNNNGVKIQWGCGKQPYTEIIGKGRASEASNAIIAAADKDDPRPLWISVWGGPREVAQAIWDVKNTRNEKDFKVFVSKLRVFLIGCQDATHDWLMNEFPDLFIIESKTTYQGMFGSDSREWVETNIINNHGPLGAIYPPKAIAGPGVIEGDSPAFLYLISANRGINNPENPTQPSWGGQYVRKGTTNHYVDGPGGASISKWKNDFQTEFKERADWMIQLISIPSKGAPFKPRLVVLTDISTWEPDDHESLIRLLVHADLFEIEGIIVTTGWSMDNVNNNKQFIDIAKGVIAAYEKDLPNLLKRSNQTGFEHDNDKQEIGYWPSAQYLRDRLKFGSMRMGMSFIGAANNSDGSNLIIKLADEDDNRPIWVTFWGGGNTLAQSIWQVKQTKSESELKTFLHKIRAYAITDQDRPQNSSFETSSHAWMRRNFSNDLLFIWDDCAWKYQNGTGKSKWSEYETNIQNHGNLGSDYPKYVWGVEGDTPAFLHIMPNGLNNPDIPTQAGWGGYSEWGLGEDKNGYSYVNYTGTANSKCWSYENQFYPATFNNFAARMDWAKVGTGNRNPIVVIDGEDGINFVTKKPQPGASIVLDASASFDPEVNSLSYKWWIQPEAGTYSQTVTILNSNTSKATIKVPSNSPGKSFHVICEVTDNGIPNLSSYRRIIFEPQEASDTTKTGMENLDVKDMKLYPNPASDELMINLNNNFTGKTFLALYNTFGKEVFTENFSESEHRLNLNAIPTGIYLLSLTNDQEKIVKKLIKN